MKPIYEFLTDLASQDIKLWVEGDRLRCNAPKGVLTPDIRFQLAEQKAEILSFLQSRGEKTDGKSDLRIVPISRQENLPLSFAQQRLWFLSELERDAAVYNIPAVLHLTGVLDVTALKQSLQEIVKRHEVLRTSFTTVDNSPIQVIHPEPNFDWLVVDLENGDRNSVEVQIEREVQTPFDLAKDSLLRVKLLRLAEKEHILLLTMHHIIADGWSLGILVRELSALYPVGATPLNLPYEGRQYVPSPKRRGGTLLQPLSIQYADFAVWQRRYLEKNETRILDYWKRQLTGVGANGCSPLLELPTDYPCPSVQTFRGSSCNFSLSPQLTQKLKTLSQQSEASLFIILLAALGILLSRYSRQKDLVIGTAIANRNIKEIEPLIGFFANTLALRLNLTENPSFKDFLAQVRQTTLDAYAHQDLPFDRLVEELQPERSSSHSPLFQVMFALQNAPLGELNLPGLTLKPIETKSVTAKFDLTLSLRETETGLAGIWEYNSDLFKPETIKRMMGNYQTLLEAIVTHPDKSIANLPLLNEAARQQILVEWNASEVKLALPRSLCIHQLFEQQVEKTPDAVAVDFKGKQLTYRQLNRKANQLGHYLQTQEIERNLVGVCLDRSPETIIALLGILKAGLSYLPLESTYPLEYLKSILSATSVSLVLSRSQLQECLPKNVRVICLESNKDAIAQCSQENLTNRINSDTQAYIVYSQHQAISVNHKAIAFHLNWLKEQFALSESDRVLHQANLTQSSAVWEIFGTLVTGGRLVMVYADNNDPAYLQYLIVSKKVSLIHFVPSELSAFLNSDSTETIIQSKFLRRVFCSGEWLSPKLIDKYDRVFPCSLYQYGLSETAGEILYRKIDRQEYSANVFPINTAKSSVYVLDEQLQPVPIGVTGEIYLGGYLNNSEVTAQRFVNNPFSKTPLFKTNQLGRLLDRGYLELLVSGDRQVEIKGYRVSLAEIEAKLLEHSSVKDCRILLRQTNTITQLVAYVVTSGQFDSEQLRSHLQTVLPSYMLPNVYISLSILPLTSTGQVDEKALKSLPAIDSNLRQQWEEHLNLLSEIDRVAVTIQPQTKTIPPVHLSDLLLPVEKITTREKSNKSLTPLPKAELQQSDTTKLAIVHGELLEQEVNSPVTLAEVLQRAASKNSTKEIVYIRCDGSEFRQSYADLLEEAQIILAGLRKLGLKPQDKVIFQLERIQDFVTAFWGCILGGFVPVPVSIPPTYEQVNSAVSKLQNAWQMLDKPIILAGDSSVDKVRHLSELQLDFEVIAIADLKNNQPDPNWHHPQPDDLAILLLTSGSTGMPKAVMQSHRSILSRSAATARMNNFSSDDVSLNWFPLDHVGGLVMFHLRDVYLGCQQIQVHTELILQQPLKWLDLIEHYRATITWSPNFAYGTVVAKLQLSQKEWDLSSMRFILNGGEAIVAKSARKFLELLAPHNLSPNAMYPAWGMSETCSGVIYSHNFSLDSTTDEIQNVEVGMPIPGCSVRIANQNQIVAESTIGKVQVKGLSVTSGYYQNSELNREAFTDDGWFNTGDLGFLNEGRLTITGRVKDVIIINGVNYYAHEIESVVEEIEGVEVSYTAAVAVRDGISDTDKLVILFNSSVDDETKLIKTIRTTVVQNIGINPDYLLPVAKESIPKTSIGKIQRSQLSQQFLAGEFDSIIKKFDLLLENNNTLPDWFYRQVWQPKEVSVSAIELTSTLVFLDSLGLGTSICREFDKSNQPYIQVEAGIEFVRIDRTCYQIDPNQPKHYQYLFESLANDDFDITQILHLWTCDRDIEPVNSIEELEQAQVKGIYSLLYLVQALSQVKSKSVRLQVVSNNAQLVDSTDIVSKLTHLPPKSPKLGGLKSISPQNWGARGAKSTTGFESYAYQKAPILGFIKTISQEMPWLNCRHIDLNSDLALVNTAFILDELKDLSADTEVVYRNGQRLVSRLAKVDSSRQEKQPIPLKKEGMYLVTGGLGGVGLEIAKYLLKTYQARLLLVGRTSLEVNSEKLQSYRELEKLGGKVSYQAVDICDRIALQQVVNQAKTNWESNLEGIIHLAGVFQERLLTEETQESIAAVLRPKVIGTWVLHQLLDNEGIFINFSSVNGFFGGTGVGAYAAANSFINNFAQYQKQQTSLQSYCFAWSMWDELGMSRGYQYKDLTRDRGFYIMNPTQGINSFLAGLHHNQAQLLIGLDGSNSNLRSQIISKSDALEKLTAYFTSNNAASIKTTELIVRDRFGTKTNCDLVKLDAMPLTETGEVDRDLLTLNSVKTKSDHTQPQTEIEQKIADIWQEVLKVSQINIQDNFFELGGHSLLATQVMSRIREAFAIELPLSSLFASPTVEGLSQQVEAFDQTPLLQSDLELKVDRIQPVSRDRDLPLSFAQQRLWFLWQLEGANSTYNVPAALRLKGSLDINALEKAFQEIARRHEVLRTRFPMVEGKPIQAIDSDYELSLTVVDLQQLSETEQSVSAQNLATESAQTPFDLAKDFLLRVKLLQLSETEHILLLNMHHIIADGWSLGILVRELSVLYETFNTKKPSPLPELPIQYVDFAIWQRQYLVEAFRAMPSESFRETPLLDYWKQQLRGIPPLLELPTDYPRPPVQTLRGNSIGFNLDRKITEKLKTLSQQSDVTLFMTLLAGFSILLSRYSRQEDLVIGTAIANRNRKEIEPLIGFFTNTLALRLDLQNNPSFKELLQRVRQVTLDAYAYQDLPFEQLVDEIQPERNLSHSPLFQVSFVLQNAPLEELKLSGLTWSPLETENVTAKFDLNLAMRETEAGLEGVWEYNCDLFEASTIERMMGHFQFLLEGIVTNPNESVTNLPLLTQPEQQQLLEWNNTTVDYPSNCIHELFELQVAKTPDAVAVVYKSQQLTYTELNAKANQLAHYLKKLGVGEETLVGVCCDRSCETIIAVLAILKAGFAYVPFDPTYPTERLAYMLSDTGVKLVLTQQSLLEKLSTYPVQLLPLDSEWDIISQESEANLKTEVTPDNLAYVMYTSGSTGQPKGVEVLHRGVVRLLFGVDYVRLDNSQTLLQLANIAFDASTFEIWGALLHGGKCVLFPGLVPTFAELSQVIKRHKVTTLWLTAALFNSVIDDNSDTLSGISQLLIGGEALSPTHVLKAQQSLPETQIINGYGPTESTTFTCCYPIPRLSRGERLFAPTVKSIPIGRPIANTQVYLLDRALQPVPIGVPGELYIAGDGLARGYLNQPELTVGAFYRTSLLQRNLRLYKTGDLAKYQPNGNIEYLGRIDNQVKIRGFRVELGEIETVLSQNPDVREAVVLTNEQLSNKPIIAYIVPQNFNPSDEHNLIQNLRNYLKQHLPEYMIPSNFVTLDILPLTSNGKVDRRALAVLDVSYSETKANFIPPRTTTEETLSKIWAEVLGLEQVGIENNFFELGGDSILSIQIVAKANQAGLQLTPKQMFQHQTIAELASVVGTTKSVSSQQDIVTGEVPLTPIQHWFFEQNLAEPYQFNQAVLLEVEPDLKPELLELAIATLLQHHDALRLQFIYNESDWTQINAAPNSTIPWQIQDLSDLSDEKQRAIIRANSHSPLRDLDSGLVQIVLFNLGNNKPGRLFIVIHHLAVDGVSWRILLEDVATAYQQLDRGEAIQLPPKTTSFQEWAIELQAYARSQNITAELNYWLTQSRFHTVLPVDYPEGKEDNTVANSADITVSLSEADTRALLQEVPSTYNTQINDVLLTALLQCFTQWTGENDLLVDLEGHGREEIAEHIDLSRTVGWFTSIYPLRLQQEESSHLGEILKSVKEQLRQVPRRGIGYGILRYLGDRTTRASLAALPSAEVSFNYLGQFEQTLNSPPILGVAQEQIEKERSDLQKRQHLLEINSIISDRKLQITWTYSEKVHHQATVEHLAASFLAALQAAIKHCQSQTAKGYTPSDFAGAKLNQKQLDKFINKFKKNNRK